MLLGLFQHVGLMDWSIVSEAGCMPSRGRSPGLGSLDDAHCQNKAGSGHVLADIRRGRHSSEGLLVRESSESPSCFVRQAVGFFYQQDTKEYLNQRGT